MEEVWNNGTLLEQHVQTEPSREKGLGKRGNQEPDGHSGWAPEIPCTDGEASRWFQQQGQGDCSGLRESWTEKSTDMSLMKTWSRALRTSDWAKASTSYRVMTLSAQPRQCRTGLGTTLNVLERPSQSPDTNVMEHICRELKVSVHQQSQSKPDEAWEDPQSRIVENWQIKLCKGHCVVPKKSRGCNIWLICVYLNPLSASS